MGTSKAVVVAGYCLLLCACAVIRPPQPPSLQLPEPPKDLHAIRIGNNVQLQWSVPASSTDRTILRSLGPTLICRSLDPKMPSCVSVGQARPVSPVPKKDSTLKVTASYTDVLPRAMQQENPLGTVTYAVEVLNANGRGASISNRVQVPLAETLPSPADFAANVESDGVRLTWSAEKPDTLNPQISYRYAVYRRLAKNQQSQPDQQNQKKQPNQQWMLVGEVPVGGAENPSLLDSTIEWEQTYFYRMNVATIISEAGKRETRIDGEDTSEIEVFTHDVFPPAVPTGLQAVSSGPGQPPFVDLIWAPVSAPDLAGYNVYRREAGGTPVKINSELIQTPAYRDTTVRPGREYFYSVSAVDIRGNESARSEEAEDLVP